MALKTWDGTKWVDTATAHQHDTYLQLIGGTMTGFITLNADPTQPLHPATKQYVDGIQEGLHTIDTIAPAGPSVGDVWVNPDSVPEGLYLLLSGGTMTGSILGVAGSIGALSYSFAGNPSAGIFLSAPDIMSFVTADTDHGAIDGFGSWRIGQDVTGGAYIQDAAGNPTFPTYSFRGDTDTGMYRASSNRLGFSTLALERVYIDNGGLTVRGDSTVGVDFPELGSDQGNRTVGLRVVNDGLNLELGRVDGVASFPLIDFHSSTASADYNARIIVSGGTSVNNSGNMTISAASLNTPALLMQAVGTIAARTTLVAAPEIPLLAVIEHLLDRIEALEVHHP